MEEYFSIKSAHLLHMWLYGPRQPFALYLRTVKPQLRFNGMLTSFNRVKAKTIRGLRINLEMLL